MTKHEYGERKRKKRKKIKKDDATQRSKDIPTRYKKMRLTRTRKKQSGLKY